MPHVTWRKSLAQRYVRFLLRYKGKVLCWWYNWRSLFEISTPECWVFSSSFQAEFVSFGEVQVLFCFQVKVGLLSSIGLSIEPAVLLWLISRCRSTSASKILANQFLVIKLNFKRNFKRIIKHNRVNIRIIYS